jgi:hypothetical protein
MGDASLQLLPADRPIEEVIDHYIGAHLRAEGIEPAPRVADHALVRRLMLDLAGRIPTLAEVQAYAGGLSPQRRQELVDRLLSSPDYVLHQRNELEYLLFDEGRSAGAFRDWLAQAVRDNRSWDAMFRDMLLSPEDAKNSPPALQFIKTRGNDIDRLTTDVSSLFFGVNISCAKCHDHPLVPDWKQDHYYGLQAFLSRTYLTKNQFVAERDGGEVKFKTTSGQEKVARVMFLTGDVVEPPTAPEKSAEEKKQEQSRLQDLDNRKEPHPAPAYSLRQQLVEVALKPDNAERFFARAIVNRLWHRLLGHGLVSPVDQMHSENPPSHPELLAWLARDLQSHGYDLKRLIRGIVLSETYARSTRWEHGPRPAASLFAVLQPRILTPRQYAISLRLASSNPDAYPSEATTREDWARQVDALERSAAGFAGLIEVPRGDDFQISVTEALLFSNSDRVEREFLRDGGDTLVGKLKTLAQPAEQVETAFWTVLSRPPDDEELKLFAEYLEARRDRPLEGLKQMVWILLAGTEFRFNH